MQRQQPGPLGHGQPGQRIPACHNDQAPWAARQKRSDLLHVTSVVQDNENSLSSQDTPVQASTGVGVTGYVPGRYPQRVEESAQRVHWCSGGIARVESAQVQVELTVFKVLRDVMGPVDGEGGLTDTGHAIDHVDGDGTGEFATWAKHC
jgi:hypothetical protein